MQLSRAPVDAPELASVAGQYVRDLLEHLDYVGVLALELFVSGDKLLANEFAPRVHNSGHWTIEGAETSQFANLVNVLQLQKLQYHIQSIHITNEITTNQCLGELYLIHGDHQAIALKPTGAMPAGLPGKTRLFEPTTSVTTISTNIPPKV